MPLHQVDGDLILILALAAREFLDRLSRSIFGRRFEMEVTTRYISTVLSVSRETIVQQRETLLQLREALV